jgi:hypothetical protein
MDIKGAFNKPFDEAISFFENKLKLPTASYTDIFAEQHSHAFVVAGAMNDALVEDFYNALHKAMTEGTGLKAFQADFDNIVAKHGWSHHGTAEWRSKLIYNTNIRQAYNVGQYQQMMDVIEFKPYWGYKHVSITNPRIEHVHLDGLTLPATDPVWNYIMPQNGYGCQCQVISYSRTEWNKTGLELSQSPTIEWHETTVGTRSSNPRNVKYPVINVTKNGKLLQAPIDPGFAYNPAKAYLEPFTAPPLKGYDAVLKTRTLNDLPIDKSIVPPLPTPQKIESKLILPADTEPKKAVEDFLNLFGATIEKGAVIEDAAGSPVVLTKRLFADETGSFAAVETKTIQNMNLLALSLADPDEVWYHWEQDKASPDILPDTPLRWRLKRRYIKTFEVSGEQKTAVTAFEWSKIGWVGETTRVTDNMQEEMDKLRVGALVYSAEKK